MHEIVIISGKGGAGKTTFTGAFAQLADNAILCDLDVDAPDLHLLLDPQVKQKIEFWSGNEAIIDEESCQGCNICADMCRFDAIEQVDGVCRVKPFYCEGCKVCVQFCPADAIAFPQKHCGDWYVSETRFAPMVHAQLYPGEENSGRLVTELKKRAKSMAEVQGLELVLSDGAPGIGCPVIASLAGTDMAVVITEPTPSGLHDLERVAELCDRFRTKVAVIINKWDVNPEMAETIETLCRDKDYAVICRVPHTRSVVDAMVEGKVITEHDPNELGPLFRQAWDDIIALLPNKSM